VVCAYNEADRIRRILDAVHNHPALAEVIVVNDGSTDDTQAVLNDYPEIRAISYTPNRGKTCALTRGIAAATQRRWHLDEAFVKVNGKLCYLWRAVDHEGEGLCHVADATSAKRQRLMDGQAAATAVRHVVIATPRSARCVWAEMRWRWTLKVL
jgi:glycosyltransferase involved in cell wall biosynthesis